MSRAALCRSSAPDPPISDCAAFSDTAQRTCCNLNQTEAIIENFSDRVEPLMGACPICVENLRKLWCGYTCSHNQSAFVNVTSAPDGPLATTFYVCEEFATALYTSCADVSFGGGATVKELWDTPLKFLQMQGSEQSITPILVPSSASVEQTCFAAEIRPCQCGCDCNSCAAKCEGVPCPGSTPAGGGGAGDEPSVGEWLQEHWLACSIAAGAFVAVLVTVAAASYARRRRAESPERTPLLSAAAGASGPVPPVRA
eukprot:tig00000204_g17761.t1